MTYFETNYKNINLLHETSDGKGLRNAQIGAYHAIGSFFTLHSIEPAIVVMPTGSGKTAVLILSSYLLKAKRVLVISSSVLVRGQIVNEFSKLETLKYTGVFSNEIISPKVAEIKSPIRTKEAWEELSKYDVVVGIPNSINEGVKNGLAPDENFFDLILVDEAHHTPANTWSETIKSFASAKKIYFTATPFRRDRKEIEGKIAYSYPLSKAYEDKIFGNLGFYSLEPKQSVSNDLLIAQKTEDVFKNDRASKFDHYIIVRTDSMKHADELEKLYSDHTSLKLKKVHSRLSYSTIKGTIEKLKNKELDGIITVNMLGEGFDFPNLKIAAIHVPQKSLAATLQFIGRFARTNAKNISSAKFIALKNDIEIGKTNLYKEDAVWIDLIQDLSEEKIAEEDNIKQVIDSYEALNEADIIEPENISLYNLTPYYHVKIYNSSKFKLDGTVSIPNHEVVKHLVSDETSSIVIITKEKQKPKWITSDELVNIKYHLFVIYFDNETNLIFINSTIKTPFFYDDIVTEFCLDEPEQVPKEKIHKVLAELKDTRFFNLGLQNRSSNAGESYITKAGSDTQNTITASDGRMYANGHVFGTAFSSEGLITIGYSSGAKVWSNSYEQIPKFLVWCKSLGKKISSDNHVITNSGFDNIPVPKVVSSLPKGIKPYIAQFNKHVFTHGSQLIIKKENETFYNDLFYEVDVNISPNECNDTTIVIRITYDNKSFKIKYSFEKHYQLLTKTKHEYEISFESHSYSLIDYLNAFPFDFQLTDFSTLTNNNELIKSGINGYLPFDKSQIQPFDWAQYKTDIKKEFGESSKTGHISIHDALKKHLSKQNYNVLIYDHGTGETADFISVKDEAHCINIELYHVKSSGGEKPSDRVNDVYEVCGQANKSLIWTVNKTEFKTKIETRVSDHPQKFIFGNKKQFTKIINKEKVLKFTIIIVQPGLSQNSLTPKIGTVLAATDDYIRKNGNNEVLKILGSYNLEE